LRVPYLFLSKNGKLTKLRKVKTFCSKLFLPLSNGSILKSYSGTSSSSALILQIHSSSSISLHSYKLAKMA